MTEQVYWYTTHAAAPAPALDGRVDADAVVVGGGIAGLSAAQWLREEAGLDVVLLERGVCGSGATGRSSGFITPDSELELHQLARRFGDADAAALWRGAWSGVEQIRANIDRFGIDCDRVDADSLYVASTRGDASVIRTEHDAHRRLEFASTVFDRDDVPSLIGTDAYHAGVRYPKTFAINGYAYAQGLKRALVNEGVRVHEHTPAVSIGPTGVTTPAGSVRARHVFVCLDRFAPAMGVARDDDYHAQTFLIVSEPLDDTTLARVFPAGPMMVWDTDLVYQYYRPTGDNRLLVGGGGLAYTYRARETHGPNAAVRGLVDYARRRFPFLNGVRFTHYWPGLIGVTKDLLPLAGRSPRVPSHAWAMCAAGLPWSTLAGRVAAQRMIEGATPFDRFFDPARASSPLEPVQPLLRKPATFALSHYINKYHQRGHADRVARQQRLVRAALLAAGAVAAGLTAAALVRTARPRSSARAR